MNKQLPWEVGKEHRLAMNIDLWVRHIPIEKNTCEGTQISVLHRSQFLSMLDLGEMSWSWPTQCDAYVYESVQEQLKLFTRKLDKDGLVSKFACQNKTPIIWGWLVFTCFCVCSSAMVHMWM